MTPTNDANDAFTGSPYAHAHSGHTGDASYASLPRSERSAAITDDALIRELLIPTRRLNVARLRRALRVERARQSICRACGRPAWYVPRPDRFFHADGSDNRTCWLAYSRGEVP
ncbi:Uncharacterised protein [Mycobacteroides abscessus subsp. abscessus]|nr:Uncharacterised protein [Mycobacteroides abscessus subsp. abscessus]